MRGHPAATVDGPCPLPQVDDPITVVIATRDRPDHVRACLGELLAERYAAFEVIVVDNAASTDATREVVTELVGADPRFRYLSDPVAGVSRARNTGWRAARTELVAFVDDDVRVDPFWLQGLVRAFRSDPAVVCVTGLVATRTISGPEQRYFDSRVSWAANLEPQVWGATSDDPLHPWAAGRFGAGANMAFRRSALQALGGFDRHLGPGTSAKGGEDIDLFVRALRSGGRLRYEPAALAWHVHRSEAGELEAQMYGYGVGLTAYLTKHALSPAVALEMVRKLPRAVRHILRVTRAPQEELADAGAAERRFRRIELTGMLLGPWYYFRARLAGPHGRAGAS